MFCSEVKDTTSIDHADAKGRTRDMNAFMIADKAEFQLLGFFPRHHHENGLKQTQAQRTTALPIVSDLFGPD